MGQGRSPAYLTVAVSQVRRQRARLPRFDRHIPHHGRVEELYADGAANSTLPCTLCHLTTVPPRQVRWHSTAQPDSLRCFRGWLAYMRASSTAASAPSHTGPSRVHLLTSPADSRLAPCRLHSRRRSLRFSRSQSGRPVRGSASPASLLFQHRSCMPLHCFRLCLIVLLDAGNHNLLLVSKPLPCSLSPQSYIVGKPHASPPKTLNLKP